MMKLMRLMFFTSLVAVALLSLGSVPEAPFTGKALTALTATEAQANQSFQSGWESGGEATTRLITTWQTAKRNECTKKVIRACRKCANRPGYSNCMAGMGITSAGGLCHRCGF